MVQSQVPSLHVLLRRMWKTAHSTVGNVYIDNIWYCYSLELPWQDNQHNISCIPTGTYQINLVEWPERLYGLFPCLSGVPNRDGIFIHVANYPKDIGGCIGLGKQRTDDGDILDSASVISDFYYRVLTSLILDREVEIEIVDT